MLVQVSSPLGSRSNADSGTMSPALWQTTGMVRQSIVDLYRARRLLVQSTLPIDPSAAGAEAAPSAAPASLGQPVASAAANAPAQSASVGGTKSLPQPADPPAPNAANSAFDPGKTIDTNLEMRVALAKNSSNLEVATSVDGYLMDLGGQNYCNLPAQSSVVLRPQGSGMAAGSCTLSSSVWLEPGEGGYVYVGDSWYRGRVLLLTDGSGLMAVNFVLMHDYLSSVVGSEMYVNWPAEALKAQAVAARSYALVHHVRHAKRAYDLDNTQRYQAYLGIGKETNTTQAAVMATTGEFISYDGGIVESLYAASDAIVQAAHGGNGMSQTGAMELATKGYNYTQILGNYYPGTSLSRLVVE
ncbi:MAG: stage II sporulation protein [Leptolyngbya sp.]|uniref:Stage II sporulation protein n=1 Tax=Shackletoniella antarctica TaxID=268115 RepID=A0A2W4Y3Q7_9CYAN|nr:MAG: stage II sporulation protein [Shackletoniella antarctica]PZV11124.1 MAG: stage II sporulation protein [Leptolyngbya sp.]